MVVGTEFADTEAAAYLAAIRSLIFDSEPLYVMAELHSVYPVIEQEPFLAEFGH